MQSFGRQCSPCEENWYAIFSARHQVWSRCHHWCHPRRITLQRYNSKKTFSCVSAKKVHAKNIKSNTNPLPRMPSRMCSPSPRTKLQLYPILGWHNIGCASAIESKLSLHSACTIFPSRWSVTRGYAKFTPFGDALSQVTMWCARLWGPRRGPINIT